MSCKGLLEINTGSLGNIFITLNPFIAISIDFIDEKPSSSSSHDRMKVL